MSLVMIFIGFGLVQVYPSVKDASGFQDLLSDPVYSALLGSQIPDLSLLEGYLAIEVFAFLWIFIAPFALLLGANAISGEIEGKTIDILLSHPVKRYRVVLDKFLAFMLYLTIVMVVTWLSLIWGIQNIGEPIDQERLFYAVWGAYLLFTAMASYSFLFSCIFDDSRKALSAAFGVLFGTYFLNILAGIVEYLEILKYLSPFHYYNPSEILFEGVFNTTHLLILIFFSATMILVSVYWFQRKDIYIT